MRYFVSYKHSEGYGNAEIDLNLPIRNLEDIRVIQKRIKIDFNASDVIIVNYKILGDDE